MLSVLLTCWILVRFLAFSANYDGKVDQPSQPHRQPVIETSSVKRFRRWMKIALRLRNEADPDADDALIVVIYGNSGLGKTFAIRAFLEGLTERTVTGLPLALRIEVKQKVTAKGLARQILAALGEVPRSREFYDYIDEVKEAILGSGVALFIFDEADRLDEETFEFLRSMTDLTRIPIALVGLPTILQVIKPHKKFRDRVAMKIPFEALDTEEVLHSFLPHLVIPRWSFHPENPQDRETGLYLWERARPALRRVRKILRLASKVAAVDQADQIQFIHIKEAFSVDPDDELLDDDSDSENGQEEVVDERHGPHEKESEQRRDAKERKKGQRRKQQ
jgi:type II secretory pathway predicted ATPase ExeA